MKAEARSIANGIVICSLLSATPVLGQDVNTENTTEAGDRNRVSNLIFIIHLFTAPRSASDKKSCTIPMSFVSLRV